jgi:hypothetical protein
VRPTPVQPTRGDEHPSWRPIVISFRITAEVKDDCRVVLTLPPDVPTGEAELVVTVESSVAEAKQARPHLADRADKRFRRNGKELARYPLRGRVVRYEQPTEPVAEADWEALG